MGIAPNTKATIVEIAEREAEDARVDGDQCESWDFRRRQGDERAQHRERDHHTEPGGDQAQ